MERVLEPEVMHGINASAYADAAFGEVNEVFCNSLLEAFPEIASKRPCAILDMGCGPGDIPVYLAEKFPGVGLSALDASEDMLDIARTRVARARLGERVSLVCGRVPDVELPPASFDYVVSNGTIHHLPDPLAFWRWTTPLLRRDGGIFVRDLRRPRSSEEVDALLEKHAADAHPVLREDHRNSFLAAFTVDEVRDAVAAVGLGHLRVEEFRDCYWIAYGRVRG